MWQVGTARDLAGNPFKTFCMIPATGYVLLPDYHGGTRIHGCGAHLQWYVDKAEGKVEVFLYSEEYDP